MSYIVTNGDAFIRRGDKKLSPFPVCKNFGEMADFALAQGCDFLYIVPGSEVVNRIGTHKGLYLDETTWNVRPSGKLAKVHTLWKKSGSKPLRLVVLDIDKEWTWKLQDITDLFKFDQMVNILHYSLGVFPTTPVMTAKAVLDKSTKNTKFPSLDQETAVPFLKNKVHDLLYKRPIDDLKIPELIRAWPYFVIIDKKHQYLSAAQNVNFGLADFQHVGGFQPFDRRRAGVWKISVKEPAQFTYNPLHLAAPGMDLIVPGEKYVYTPELEFLAGQNVPFEVLASWTFKVTKRALKTFAETFIQGRKAIEESAKLEPETSKAAVACLKAGYTRFFGWLSALNPSDYGLWRPDWFYSIKSLSKANMARNIVEQYERGGKDEGLLIGGRVDALCYLVEWNRANITLIQNGKYRVVSTGDTKDILSIWNKHRTFAAIDDEICDKGKYKFSEATQ